MTHGRLLEKLSEKVPSIEHVVWAHTETKRCSHAPEGARQHRSELRTLGVEVLKEYICSEGWPQRAHFDRYDGPPAPMRNCDRSEGLYLDIPMCCATAYSNDVREHTDAFFRRHPYRRGTNRLPRTFAQMIAHMERFKIDDEPQLYTERDETMKRRILEGKIPESAVFLNWMYVPCVPECAAFITQSTRMHDALRSHLPSHATRILDKYRRRTFENVGGCGE
ncbi:TPA: hypothetical protein HA251_08390 [Candidatus Woesearchaeota archaeon]|nr:hypothetical protein [Candidatus Woesearchaeota archaeon]